MRDGDQLPGGLTVSAPEGYRPVAAYRCKCGREQPAECPGFERGISVAVAEFMGWRMIGGAWECPFCTGNLENLRRLFQSAPEGE